MVGTPAIFRLVTHGFIVFLALAAAMVGSARVAATSRSALGGPDFLTSWRAERWSGLPTDAQQAHLRMPPLLRTQRASSEPAVRAKAADVDPIIRFSVRAPIAATTAPETASPAVQRRAIQEYEVAPGDTLSGIATRFGLDITTLLWANGLKDTSVLQPGDTLKVLPVNGLLHEVRSGDTLLALAARYKVDVEDITGYPENDLSDPNRLAPGKELVIPGGIKPPDPKPVILAAATAPEPAPAPPPPAAPSPPPAASAGFIWPTYGPIFTYFSGYHAGLDISPPYGTPVVAAMSGVVAQVNRWNYSYGYHIIVNHGNGLSTLYSHLSEILVGAGQAVAQGQLIGRVGSTGRSTGPHLHFEVHRNGSPIDPLGVLPR